MCVSNRQLGHLENEVFLWLTDRWPGREPRISMNRNYKRHLDP